MAALPKIPTDTSVIDFLSKVYPKVSAEMAAVNPSASELSGSTITMVVDVDGDAYSYTIKDGSKVEFKEGAIDKPMLKLKMSKAELDKMIKTDNLDLILGMQNGLNKAKYNALNSLKGSFLAAVTTDDGYVFNINATLNNADTPHSVFRMTATDSAALMRKDTNPVNLFMSGAMKIEGDMAFAMATQPLFS